MKVADLKFVRHDLSGNLLRDQSDKVYAVAQTLKGKRPNMRAEHTFANGHEISIVTGDLFYSTSDSPYEAMVLTAQAKKWQGPLGYLDERRLQKLLDKVEKWKPVKNQE